MAKVVKVESPDAFIIAYRESDGSYSSGWRVVPGESSFYVEDYELEAYSKFFKKLKKKAEEK